MNTNKLYSLAASDGIRIDRAELPHNRSVSIRYGKKMYIGLDKEINTRAEERVCLAHELGHCETLSFYNLYAPLEIRAKHEIRADRWAIEQLVSKEGYFSALQNGYTEIHTLAELFEVTEDFMRKAAEYYRAE